MSGFMRFRSISIQMMIFLIAFSSVGNAFSLARHRYHSSLTLVEYSGKEKLFEVTIQLFTHDLVNVLESDSKSPVDLSKDGEGDERLFEYLNANFSLKDKDGNVLKSEWVGKEVKVDRVDIFLQIPFGGDLEKFELKNSIFFEAFSEQKNLVTFRIGELKQDLIFKVGDKVKTIQLKEPEDQEKDKIQHQ